MYTLTPNEQEILDLMWREGRTLSRAEIMNLLPEKSWSESSIHILLNKLLDKGAVVADGFIKVGRSVGRTYSAAITPEDYMIMQMKSGFGLKRAASMNLVEIFSTLINDKDVNTETIATIEKILREKKKELQS